MIRQNYDAYSKVAKEDHLKSITAYEVQKLAIAEEYKIFTNNKVVTMYRRGLAFLMSDIKGKYYSVKGVKSIFHKKIRKNLVEVKNLQKLPH